MIRSALYSLVGVISCLFSLTGQSQVSTGPRFDATPFNSSFAQLPPLTLADENRFSFMTAMSWHKPVEYLPPFNPNARQDVVSANNFDHGVGPDKTVELRPMDRIYVGGEIGLLYGRSTGKYGYEYEQGYVIGEIGNDWFQITVGTSYERTSWRLPNH